MFHLGKFLYCLLICILLQIHCCCGVPLLGIGASLPAEVYSSWRPKYEYARGKWTRLKMDYDNKNSWTGKHIMMVDPEESKMEYGATDAEMTLDEKKAHPNLTLVPVIAG